jgi:acetolactate synthase-1/2/3 large subunit
VARRASSAVPDGVATLRLHFVIETGRNISKAPQKWCWSGQKLPRFFCVSRQAQRADATDCETTTLCPVDGDPIAALEALAAELGRIE